MLIMTLLVSPEAMCLVVEAGWHTAEPAGPTPHWCHPDVKAVAHHDTADLPESTEPDSSRGIYMHASGCLLEPPLVANATTEC